MSRKFNIGDKARIIGSEYPFHHHDIGAIGTVVGFDTNYHVLVDSLYQFVNPKDLEPYVHIPTNSYANYLLSRIYEESIANGIAKVDGRIMPIIPGALMEELENYLTKEEDK